MSRTWMLCLLSLCLLAVPAHAQEALGLRLETAWEMAPEDAIWMWYDFINDGQVEIAAISPDYQLFRYEKEMWQPLTPERDRTQLLETGLTLAPGDVLHALAELPAYGQQLPQGQYRIVHTVGTAEIAAEFEIVSRTEFDQYLANHLPVRNLSQQEAAAFTQPQWDGFVVREWIAMAPSSEEGSAEDRPRPQDGLPRAMVIAQRGGETAFCIVRQAQDGAWAMEAACMDLLRPGAPAGLYNPYIYHVADTGIDFCYDVTDRGEWDEGASIIWRDGQWHVTSFFQYFEDGLVAISYDEEDYSYLVFREGSEAETEFGTFFYDAPIETCRIPLESFSRTAMAETLRTCYENRNGPLWFSRVHQSDNMPEPILVAFPKGKTHDVYTGPGTHYLREAEGRAQVSTNGWIQVLGREADWLLVHYNVDANNNRMGYIHASALPDGVKVPSLAFSPGNWEGELPSGCLTNDPLRNHSEITFLSETDAPYVTVLSRIGRFWYIELSRPGEQPARGFMPTYEE